MSNTTEILLDYTAGKTPLDETNAALKEAKSNLNLDPARNALTADELASTTVGETPAEANGWGLMEHGASCMEKVHIIDGHTVAADTNMGGELAFVFIGGKKYRLVGTELQDIPEEA